MGHVDMLKMLLNRGADWNLDAAGQTARSVAEKRNNREILAVLDRLTSRAN